MTKQETVVIVGAGLAGASAAFELRKLGFGGRVVLIGTETELPYERPPLSKKYLRGESAIEKAYVRPGPDYDAQGIELLRGQPATSLDIRSKRVQLRDGTAVPYDALLLATGSEPRRLDVEGTDLASVHYLRTIADADAIRSAAVEAREIAVIGGGWIGSEVVASLRELGHSVTLVSNRARPLERVLGSEIGDVYRQLHEANGVRIIRGTIASIDGEGVALDEGGRVPADLVVVGIGATPRIGLAVQAGLDLADGGIAVDEYLRSSARDVFAIGDVAAAWHPRLHRRLRIEHWDNAKRQGRAVAANILGTGQPYDRTPYFYSDQFDLGMEYRGHAPHWDQVVVRGDLEARQFHAFWLAKGRVIAAMNANVWEDGDDLLAIVESGRQVDIVRLTDPTVSLAEAA
jgi:3-phenylpropionate/trans-cinnamate dioxygenase ferredoxin reductase component